MYHPFLVGEKVYLRRMERKDLEGNYFDWLNDYEVTKMLEVGKFPNSMEAMEDYFNKLDSSPNDLFFAIIEKETDRHIGNFTIRINWVNRTAETGRIIGEKDCWGKSYGQEALKLAIDYCFKRLNLHRVQGGTVADNIAVQKIWKRLGWTVEGRLRKAVYFDGEYHDSLHAGILREEWKF